LSTKSETTLTATRSSPSRAIATALVGVTVTFIPTLANPEGEHWMPADVHWGTDKTTYTGSTELSPADLTDTILETLAADNSRRPGPPSR
jgi:hypothetical protein